MTRQSGGDGRPAWLVLITSVTVGLVAVLASVLAFDALVGESATQAAELERVASYVYWSQPFIYVLAGLLAWGGDSRRGPVRAPVVGLFLASIAWMALRKQDLIAQEPNVLIWLMTAGALFALGGALVAPLLKEHVTRVVGGVFVLGIVALVWAFLHLGSISGVVQRDVITRVGGETAAWRTIRVPEVPVALLDLDEDTILYTGTTSGSGYYLMERVPIGEYRLRVWDPATPAVITQPIEVERSITGGTRWQAVSLPAQTQETGPLFE